MPQGPGFFDSARFLVRRQGGRAKQVEDLAQRLAEDPQRPAVDLHVPEDAGMGSVGRSEVQGSFACETRRQ